VAAEVRREEKVARSPCPKFISGSSPSCRGIRDFVQPLDDQLSFTICIISN
jgi:hypothetical protein